MAIIARSLTTAKPTLLQRVPPRSMAARARTLVALKLVALKTGRNSVHTVDATIIAYDRLSGERRFQLAHSRTAIAPLQQIFVAQSEAAELCRVAALMSAGT